MAEGLWLPQAGLAGASLDVDTFDLGKGVEYHAGFQSGLVDRLYFCSWSPHFSGPASKEISLGPSFPMLGNSLSAGSQALEPAR